MKVDLSLDFNALLKEAKKQKKELHEEINKHRSCFICDPNVMDYPKDVKVLIEAAQKKWEKWLNANINRRGLTLIEDMLGNPIAISAILAGKKC